ncbi:MAG: DNA repair and recombination protein RadB [Candidatus Aenigmatarchaeota archaeon]
MRLPICAPLNKLLDGGLETGCLTNFYGPAGTGKSNIALAAAIAAVRSGKRVAFIDTEGGFSIERLTQMCNGTTNAVTDNIILLKPHDWDSQKETIRKLEKICAKENIGLIVIDSLVALWRIAVTEMNATEVNRELATQLSILANIARNRDIPVLVTNQVYADITTGKIEMSARNIVKWWSKNIIELSHAGRSGIRIATIRKARSQPEDKSVEFEITQNGLREPRFRLF